MWAPFVIAQVDTTAMTESEETTTMNNLVDAIQPGANLVVNKSIDAKVVNFSPDLQSLSLMRAGIDEEMIGNFAVPKSLLGREKTLNRATLEASLQALRESAITRIQRTLKRAVEFQVYDRITEWEGLSDQVRIKHIWNPMSIQDFKDMADAVVEMYKAKAIDQKTLFDLLNIDKLMLLGEEMSYRASAISLKPKKQDKITEKPRKAGLPSERPSGVEQEVKLK